MEKTVYTFEEKYCSMEKEKRIRRRQYFTRIAVPGILIGLCALILGGILSFVATAVFGDTPANTLAQQVINILIFIGEYVIVFKFLPIQIKKRCHDFGSTGDVESKIYISVLVASFIITLLAMVYEIYPFTSLLVLGVLGMIAMATSTLGAILGLYIWLRPGNPEANEYGENPINTKIEFLG